MHRIIQSKIVVLNNFIILQRDLQQKQAEQIVRNILHNIINGIKIQDRPPSPVDAYITEEEIFSRNNPKV